MLLFKQLAKNILSDLMQKHKMECTYADNQKIIYENKKIIIKILFNQFKTYELEMIFENKYTNNFFDVCMFLLYKKVIKKDDYRAVVVTNNDSLRKFLRKFAKFLRKFLNEILDKNNIFYEIDIFSKNFTEQYNESKRISYFKSLGHEAWSDKKYQKVIDFYSEIEEYLSESEMKKLMYAKNNIVQKANGNISSSNISFLPE